jgi:putative ABC transport system permease protein
MFLGEAISFSVNALRANRVRTFLTALGLVIGNASVILVVTISMTSRDYILEQIEGVGSNIVYAQSTLGSHAASAEVEADYIKMSDVEAVRRELASQIVAATGVESTYDNLVIDGREQSVTVLGSDQYYQRIRNLVILAGRPMDASDVALSQKVALVTQRLAKRLFRSQDAAIGKRIKVHGLAFTIVGTFKEKVESFGLSELAQETVLIPITVMNYFVPVERIDPLYIQAKTAQDVPLVTDEVQQLLESRHRPGARYLVQNLTAILDAARKIALVLSLVLVLVSAIALVISGIGIMNIMLVTVTERTKEIGLRMAVGASRRDVLQQFLLEAVLISVSGGAVGILLGVAAPLSVRYLTDFVIPISKLSIAVAFAVSCVVGLIFGILPANRAARLNPTEALRYE